MKRFFLLSISFAFVIITMAQTSGGPDPYGYTWKASTHPVNPPKYSWFDISNIGTQVSGLSDDNVVGPFNITNNFHFYWYNPSKFWIGSNGYITFDGDNIASPFPIGIPIATGPNNYIAGLLSDLNFAGTSNPGKCFYYGNADTVCISWEEVPYWWVTTPPGFTGQNSFQIILSRIDSSITINYSNCQLGNQTVIDNIMGIENVSGTLGLAPYVDSIPPDTFSIKFYHPKSTTFQVVDGGVNWIENKSTGGIFVKKDAPPIPMEANVENYGNIQLNSILVYDTLYDGTGTVVVGGSASASNLQPSDDVTVTFSDSLEFSSAGTYVNRSWVAVPGDLVPSNNSLDLEVIAVDTTGPMVLDYSDGTPLGGLAWNGGNGGIAIYIKPPIYPAKIYSSQFYINFNTTPAQGFHAMIYDDDGPNGDHGTLLDSVFVAGNNITTGQYHNVDHSASNIVIDSGGFYLVWYMGGANIQLGRDLDPPISRRTIEVIAGGWGGYRSLETEDFLMGAKVDYAWPRAAFNALTGFDPTINFVDMSTNDPVTWYWTFGDGDTSTSQNPSHDYIENGKYEVCLAVSNQWGSNSVCDSIEVKGVIPTAYFTYNDSAHPQIAFKDESVGPPTGWEWNLADTAGPVVQVQNPIYTFKNNGTRNVCLIAKNANGNSAPYCEEIEIYGIGVAEIFLAKLEVRPNPFNDKAYVDLPDHMDLKKLNIKMMDAQGSLVQVQVKLSGRSIIVDRSGLSKGQYILEVAEGTEIKAFARLMVE